MTDEASGAQGDPSVNAEPEASDPADSPPAWFADFAAEMRGKIGELGKDQGRLRSALKRSQAAPDVTSAPEAATAPGKDQAPSGDAMAEYKRQRDLMKLEASLSDDQIAWIDEKSEGLGLRERELMINSLVHGAAANAATANPQRNTTARAATAAQQRSSAAHPRSQAELSALAASAFGGNGRSVDESARRKWDQLQADPTFSAEFE